MGVLEKLSIIQTQIKAPKNMYNSFGKYNYRNAEGICEAVKPYLVENKCALTLSDKIVIKGGRYYVRAKATLIDTETGEREVAKAYARESEEKKGMDDSQISGTASSYARKYALNGLFLLDDTKDADTDEYHRTVNRKTDDTAKKKVAEYSDESLIDAATVQKIKDALKKAGKSEKGCLEYYEVKDFSELKVKQASVLLKSLGVN